MKTKVTTVLAALLIGVFASAQSNNNENNCKFDVQLTAENQITVRQTNATGSKIKVMIYNQDGERVNAKTYKCTGNMKATYNFNKLNEGNYFVKIICSNKVVHAEQLSKLADGSLSIPEQMPQQYQNPKNQNNMLISNK